MVNAEQIRADEEFTKLVRLVQSKALLQNKPVSCVKVTKEIAKLIKEQGQEVLLIDKIIPFK